MAHLRSFGKFRAIYSAVSLPVYPVAPITTISYILGFLFGAMTASETIADVNEIYLLITARAQP